MKLDQPALLQWSDAVRRCIQTCLDCHVTCLATARYGLQKGGAYGKEKHVRLLFDCSAVCHLCVVLLHSSPDLQGRICEICAEYCERGARNCEQLAEDEQLRACAESCRRCATECHQAAGDQ